MPPKSRYTKEEIANEALEIIRESGYDSLNARSLASRLNISTMPLFHSYENMEEIKKAAVQIGVERYNKYMAEAMSSDEPFKKVGQAYINFAQDEPELFRMFFMTPTEKIAGLSDTDPNTARVTDIAAGMLEGDRDAGGRLLFEMWIFVHGIATLSVTGKKKFTKEERSELTSSVFKRLKGGIQSE